MICPYCKSKNVIPVVYGYPGPKMMEASARGEIKLGGCVITIDGCDNDAYCKDCDREWSADMLRVDDIVKARYVTDSCGLETRDSHERLAYEIFPDGRVRYYQYYGYRRKALDKQHYTLERAKVINLFADLRRYSRSDYRDLLKEGEGCDGESYRLIITFVDGRKLKYDGFCYGGTFDDRMERFIHENRIGEE